MFPVVKLKTQNFMKSEEKTKLLYTSPHLFLKKEFYVLKYEDLNKL